MQRWRLVEWGLLPWIVVSQIVPLIAFAPVVNAIGNQIDRGGDSRGRSGSRSRSSRRTSRSSRSRSACCAGSRRPTASTSTSCAPTRPATGRRCCGCGCPPPCRTCCPRCGSPPRTPCSAPSSPRCRSACAAASAACSSSSPAGVERPGRAVGADLRLDRARPRRRGLGRALGARAQELPQRRGDGMTCSTTDAAPSSSTLAVRASGVGKVFPTKDGRGHRAHRRRPRGRRGRVRLAHRPVRMRQVDAAAPHRRPRPGDDRRARDLRQAGPHRRASTRTTASRSSRRACCRGAPSAANIALPLELHGVGKADARRAGRRARRARRPHRVRRPLPRPALGRHAAARRDRARPRRAARGCCSWTSRSARSTR